MSVIGYLVSKCSPAVREAGVEGVDLVGIKWSGEVLYGKLNLREGSLRKPERGEVEMPELPPTMGQLSR